MKGKGWIDFLAGHWKVITLATSGGLFLILFLLISLGLTHGRITNTGFCSLCHVTQYPAEEYMPKNLKNITDRGVIVGCAECHPQPFMEFKESLHFRTTSQDKPGCVNCHNPHKVWQFAGYMFFSSPSWWEVSGALKDNEKWEKVVRPRLARVVREGMFKEGSKKCQRCHEPKEKWFAEIERHRVTLEKGQTCIECHYNLVHKKVPWPEMEKSKI